ncbi:Lipopolysaccharide biosynthesis protein, LPS:glycosyltransferase [Arboricoccus pini]|uniref:Lipopolysaccharide biosynthesis protein, LPS:glycosyltransferase n=1 Tax=Arboricoccus pini TaxID=1963835 RepID=A0A212RR41_9PROT|nr:glycosyltransferase [Arboricoccus pini]SNB75095.1 Lipopolysaccharide biosynthesis protein, LPS:glycosyltransferase [Arboricoccus pini]
MTTRAVVFVTDRGFVFPTMVAASQVRAQVTPDEAAIIIYFIDMELAEITALEQDFAARGFQFVRLDSKEYLRDDTSFNKTHVPTSTLGRLALYPYLPSNAEHIVYIDGDTFMAGDIRPLLGLDVPPGMIAAANDSPWIYDGDGGSYWEGTRAYLDGIGIGDSRDYFNAGVLAFRRESWKDIAAEALAYFVENSERCRYHDQSALNAVCRGRRLVVSPCYNFITDYALVGAHNLCQPRLLHFTGGMKPWHFFGFPWYDRFKSDYEAHRRSFPSLGAYFKPLSAQQHAALTKERNRNVLTARYVLPWRRLKRRARFKDYQQSAHFDLPATASESDLTLQTAL